MPGLRCYSIGRNEFAQWHWSRFNVYCSRQCYAKSDLLLDDVSIATTAHNTRSIYLQHLEHGKFPYHGVEDERRSQFLGCHFSVYTLA